MGKRRRREERAQRRHLRVVDGRDEMPGRDRFAQDPTDELTSRPEYIANMKAWVQAGCPPGPGSLP